MSVTPESTTPVVAQPSDKELNFRKQEEMFTRKLDQEKQARQQAEERLSQLERLVQSKGKSDDDDDEPSDEPYVDHRRLRKAQDRMEKKIVGETDNRINQAVQAALAEERRNQWMKNNPDFFEVMNHAQAFAEKDPELAETILSMPEGFERQKLVYKNIKALGMHKKDEPKPTVQDQIDKNRRTPFYHPSGVGTAPYNNAGDFSAKGQENAYNKMKELQKRLGAFS
jgi:actin-related protein